MMELDQSKYLLSGEYEELLRVLELLKDRDKRNSTLLWTLLYTGARCGEVLRLRPMDLSQGGTMVYVPSSKGGKPREIPVYPWLFKRLESLAVGKAKDERLFPISYNRLRDIWCSFRPVKKRVHALRHTFAIRLYEKSKDIRLVQRALGHRNIGTTMVYLDYQYSTSELQRLLLS